jgi:hypothetical protein
VSKTSEKCTPQRLYRGAVGGGVFSESYAIPHALLQFDTQQLDYLRKETA